MSEVIIVKREHTTMEQIVNQLDQIVNKIIKDAGEIIAEKFNIDKVEFFQFLEERTGRHFNYKPLVVKLCSKCKDEGKEPKQCVKHSPFCEEHKRTNCGKFKKQMNRVYKHYWNSQSGLVLSLENDKVVIGRLRKEEDMSFTKDLTAKHIAMCEKYGLKYEPADLKKVEKAKKSKKDSKEKPKKPKEKTKNGKKPKKEEKVEEEEEEVDDVEVDEPVQTDSEAEEEEAGSEEEVDASEAEEDD